MITIDVAPTRTPRRGEAVDRLLHPLPVVALGLLIVNDHVIKTHHPGWVSGKLSDVAVMALLPFLLLAVTDLVAVTIPRLPPPGRLAVIATVVGSVVLFAAIELIPIVGESYRWGLGVAQWPVRALVALMASDPLPNVIPVRLTFDPSDLLALPFAAVILLTQPRYSR